MTPPRPSGAAAILLTRLLRPRRPSPVEARSLATAGRVRRVLVIKPHDQLGDLVLATPALSALRERYPEARIALLTREFLAPLAQLVPSVDQVWVLPRVRGAREALRWFAAVAALAAFRPHLTFVLNSVSRSKTADALAALSRASVVVGRSRVGAGPLPADAPADAFEAAAGLPRDPVYDLDLPCSRASRHQVDRLLDLVRWCGAEHAAATPALVLREPERVEARRALAEALAHVAPGTGEAPARIVGLHPGAANELKCWPLQSFVELGVALARGSEKEGPAPALVVFDSPRERGRAAAVCAGLEARGVRAEFLPATGIEWFAALCSHLDLLVCNDSGVMHIAAALALPTVSFHSLGDPREWGPRGARAVAFHAPKGIAAIPVAAAVEAVRALLRS